MPATTSQEAAEPKKLIVCFDGTGNSFTGSNADTNVVKLLNKLDRNDPDQYHYYQTGIGTYDINEQSVNKSMLGEIKSSISQTIDQGIGTTFDAHVMAGYRFLMRYYDSGDKIYMFGFSRGAFTAKFLARMIHTVGLLCKGNEEMVPFAFRLYQRYLSGEVEQFIETQEKKPKKEKKKKTTTNGHVANGNSTNGHAANGNPTNGHAANGHSANGHAANGNPTNGHAANGDAVANGTCEQEEVDGDDKVKVHKRKVARDEITAFSNTFCRKEQRTHCGKLQETNIKVYFLGIWDCVNSVAVLERTTPVPVPVKGTAYYVRHAVAVDERRVKFKPALLAQDIRGTSEEEEDIKEVWFPGCHGDVGGGWPAIKNNPLDTRDTDQEVTLWQRVKNFWTTRKAKEPSGDIRKDPFQMSDVPLAWMIRELELVGEKDPPAAVKWCDSVNGFKRRFQKKKTQALKGVIHDSLSFGHGTGFFKVLLWKVMEILPLITRWELENDKWVNVRFPLNKGSARDIPPDAVLHESVLWRLRNDSSYTPKNNHGGSLPPCLIREGCIADTKPLTETGEDVDSDHQTYVLTKSSDQAAGI